MFKRSVFFRQEKDDSTDGGSSEKEQTQEPVQQEGRSAAQVVKSEQWFKDMAAELKSLRAWKKTREEEASKAEKDAELKKAKAAADFDKALLIKEQEVAEANERALQAELKASLVANGAKVTPAFVKVAMAEFDPEKHGTVDSFAESLRDNEDYAAFFISDKRSVHPGPGKTPISGQQTISNDQIVAWKTSGDREERQKATKYLTEYFDAHGKLPPGYPP